MAHFTPTVTSKRQDQPQQNDILDHSTLTQNSQRCCSCHRNFLSNGPCLLWAQHMTYTGVYFFHGRCISAFSPATLGAHCVCRPSCLAFLRAQRYHYMKRFNAFKSANYISYRRNELINCNVTVTKVQVSRWKHFLFFLKNVSKFSCICGMEQLSAVAPVSTFRDNAFHADKAGENANRDRKGWTLRVFLFHMCLIKMIPLFREAQHCWKTPSFLSFEPSEVVAPNVVRFLASLMSIHAASIRTFLPFFHLVEMHKQWHISFKNVVFMDRGSILHVFLNTAR